MSCVDPSPHLLTKSSVILLRATFSLSCGVDSFLVVDPLEVVKLIGCF